MNDNQTEAAARKPWPIFRSFAGWRLANLGPDAIAGLTLAAIAIPEQMATARLGGFAPQIGFLAFIAGALGFAIFGSKIARCRLARIRRSRRFSPAVWRLSPRRDRPITLPLRRCSR